MLTIARAQDGSTARTVLVGDQVALADLAKLWQDIEKNSPAVMPQGKFWEQAISPATPTYPVQSTVVAGAASSYNAFPWCVATKFGALLVMYRHGSTHFSTDGIIKIQKSTDGGATWGSATAIATPAAGHDYRSGGMVTTKTGRIIVGFYDYNGSTVIGLYSMYSDDGGATWTSPALQTVYSSWTATVAFLQHSSGALLWGVYGRNSGDTDDRCGVLISWDDGITWSSVVNISAASAGYDEFTMIELPDHSIKAYISQNGGTLLYGSTSTDVGSTWSAVTSEGISITGGLPCAIMIPKTQTIILWYRNPGLSKTAWRYSTDGGHTFSSEQIYSSGAYEHAGGIAVGDDLIAVAVGVEPALNQCSVLFTTMQVTKRQRTLTAGSNVTLTDSADATDATISVTIPNTTESTLTLSDVTTDNVTSTAHGFAPKSPADATKYLDGAATPAWKQVQDSDLSLSDITTNNATTSQHGFVPKGDGVTTHFLRGDMTWAVTPGGAGSNWSVLTDGDHSVPELVFAGGDVIMVQS